MLSNNNDFKELLLLHGRDRRHGKLKEELNNLPFILENAEKKIKIEKESIELAVKEWKELEIRNNILEKDIILISEKISKNKVKQLEVKKNEEYTALQNEISNLLDQQSLKEDEQIEILLEIDDAQETASIAQEKISLKVKDLEQNRDSLLERTNSVKIEIEQLEKEIIEARARVSHEMLTSYDRVKKVVLKPPYIAPLNDQKCSGCNLRVSNDVVSSVLVEQKLTQCDQCGRIVYVER